MFPPREKVLAVAPDDGVEPPRPLMAIESSRNSPTAFRHGLPLSAAVQKGQSETAMENLKEPPSTGQLSLGVGEIVPASRKTSVETCAVRARCEPAAVSDASHAPSACHA